MRSRYVAFSYGDAEYLWRTWHPRTRPNEVLLDPEIQWIGLRISDVTDGAKGDDVGTVEFTASYRHTADDTAGEQHERSTFERRAGRWFYVDGS